MAAAGPNDPGTATNVTPSPLFTRLPAAKKHDVFTAPWFFPASYPLAHALFADFEQVLKHVS